MGFAEAAAAGLGNWDHQLKWPENSLKRVYLAAVCCFWEGRGWYSHGSTGYAGVSHGDYM